jgi:hypothetical protein
MGFSEFDFIERRFSTMLLRSLTKAINQLTRTFHNKKLFKCLKPRKSERCGKFDFFFISSVVFSIPG